MSDFTTLGIRIDTSQVRQADKDLNKLSKSEKSVTSRTLNMNKAFKAMASTLSALALFGTAKNLTGLADKMNLLDARVRVATSSIEDYTKASKLLVDISMRTGTNFEANTTIFVRTNKAIESMGGSIRHTARFTETLAKAMVISGATSGETTSVVRQMSQALASGVLRGDEFNSITENGARIQQLLAESLDKTKGELRTMAEHGELTSAKVMNAIIEQSKVIDAEWARMPKTVGMAMERINTAFGQYIMLADKGAGATAGIADRLDLLAKNMTPIIDSLVTLGEIAGIIFVAKTITAVTNFTLKMKESTEISIAHSKALKMNAQIDKEASIEKSKANMLELDSEIKATEASIANSTASKKNILVTIEQTEATIKEGLAELKDAKSINIATVSIERNTVAMRENSIAKKLHSEANKSLMSASAGVQEINKTSVQVKTMLGAADEKAIKSLEKLTILKNKQGKAQYKANIAANNAISIVETGTEKQIRAAELKEISTKKSLESIKVKTKLAKTEFILNGKEVIRLNGIQKTIPALEQKLSTELSAAKATKIHAEQIANKTKVQANELLINRKTQQAMNATSADIARKYNSESAAHEKVINSQKTVNNLKNRAAGIDKTIIASNSVLGAQRAKLATATEIFTKQIKGLGITAKATSLSMFLLNNAMQIFIAWEITLTITKWLKSFDSFNIAVTQMGGIFAKLIENTSFSAKLLKTTLDIKGTVYGTAKSYEELTAEYNANNKAIDENIETGISWIKSKDGINDRIQKEIEAQKLLTEARNKANDAAKKYQSTFDAQLSALDDEAMKILLLPRLYEAYRLTKLGIVGDDREKLLIAWDINQQLIAETDATNKANEAYKSQQESIKNVIDALIDKNLQLSVGAEEYQRLTLASQGLTGAKLEEAIALSKANDRLKANKDLVAQAAKITLAARTPTEIFIDKSKALAEVYNKTDMKVKVYIKTLSKLQDELKKSTKGSATDNMSKAIDDQLKSTQDYLNDLGATSQDVFGGMAGDVFNLSDALIVMTKELDINARQIKLNQDNWTEYLKAPDADLDVRADKLAQFAQNEQDLNKKTTDLSIQGYMNVGNAAIGVFNSMASAAEDGSKQQESMQKASAALTVVMAGVNGTAAVIKAFADGGWPLAIAVGGAVGGLAASIGATVAQFSGGVSRSELIQGEQGRGSVLGDLDEASQSLGNAFDELEDLASTSLEYTSQMLISLDNIDNNTKQLTNFANIDIENNRFPGITGSGTSSVGGNVKDTVQNTINKFNDSIDRFNIEYDKESLSYIRSDKTTVSEAINEMFDRQGYIDSFRESNPQIEISDGQRANQEMRDVIIGDLQSTFIDIIDNISTGASFISEEFSKIDINKMLLESNIAFDEVDFGDMDAEEFNKALNGVLGKWADQLVGLSSPELFEFQQLGEGLYQTLIRVSAQTESANVAMSKFGFEAIKYTDVLNKQGDIEAQIVKQTIVANEEFTAISDIMKLMSGDASELIGTYEELREAQYLLIGTGLGENTLSTDLIGGAGGLGELQSGLEAFYESFFTEEEKFEVRLANMQRKFEEIGVEMPKTNKAFRELLEGLDKTTPEGKLLAGQVVVLSSQFNELTQSMDESGNSISRLDEILANMERNFARLDDSPLQSTLHGISDSFVSTVQEIIDEEGSFDDIIRAVSIGLQTGARELVDVPSTLQTVAEDLGEIFRDVKGAINKDILKIKGLTSEFERDYYQTLLETGTIDEKKEAAAELHSLIMQNYEDEIQTIESFTDAIANIQDHIDSLKLNETLSVLTPQQMLVEAERQFEETAQLAAGGDVNAINELSAAGDNYLDKARVFYASSDAYTDIFNNVLSTLDGIDVPAKENFDKINADASLRAVSELEQINETLGSMHEFSYSTSGSEGSSYNRQEALDIRTEFLEAISGISNISVNDLELALAGNLEVKTDEATMFANTIAGITTEVIQSFVSDAANSAMDSYNAASKYGVSGSQIDTAMNWALGSTNTWAEQNNLDALTGINPVSDSFIRDAFDNMTNVDDLYNQLTFLDVAADQVDRAMGWDSGSTNTWADNNDYPRFAMGGIATQPSIFGEAGNEAAVPLPDGRTIPVTINQGAGVSYQELIAEVKALRADMAEQTGAIIESNYDANESNANSINTANRENTESQQWHDNKTEVI